jgi:hypothetical protein
MSKRFWSTFSSLVLIAVLVSACRSRAAAIQALTLALSPTTPPTALPTASPTASPVPTKVPTPEAMWAYKTGGAIWGAPAVNDGTVYFGSDDGNLYAVDAQNGSLRWKFPSQGIVRSRPAILGGLVYFASDDGFCTRSRRRPERKLGARMSVIICHARVENSAPFLIPLRLIFSSHHR